MRRRGVNDSNDKSFRGRLLLALALRDVVIWSALIPVKGNRAITQVNLVKIPLDMCYDICISLLSISCLCTFMVSKWILACWLLCGEMSYVLFNLRIGE
ncbi:hypothetical protein CDAR_187621 [Caerostris darwini]|uniref:Uncharacterized protein n=1 Tax=Caerostris darwini TaxID=1538125 RepID=A0AAV4V6K4_9ARAC|nr:hypothetical protein CDAR_187621 [Caerostris darwini]